MAQQVQILIEMDDKGNITVRGPIENKILCYGLLESAKDAIRNHIPSPILKPNSSDLKVIN
jgi:hypothetical protein